MHIFNTINGELVSVYESKTIPFVHQLDAYCRFKRYKYYALLADMGVGKSKISIDISSYHYVEGYTDRLVVIAPTAVHPQWINEQFPNHCAQDWRGFSYFADDRISYLRKLDGFMMLSKGNKKLSILTINFETFVTKKGLEIVAQFVGTSEKEPTFFIDEASRIKNPDAKSVVNIKKLTHKLYPKAFRSVITGTPAAKSPLDMWSIYDFLKPRYMGCSYLAFQHTHCVQVTQKIKVKKRLVKIDKVIDVDTHSKIRKMVENNTKNGVLNPYAEAAIKDRFGIKQRDLDFIASGEGFRRFKNLELLQEKIAPVTFSIKKSDCLKMPDKIYQEIQLEINKEQKELITQLAKYSATTYADKELTISVKALLGMRVLQICGGFFAHHTDIEGKFGSTPIKGKNAKLDFIIEDLKELGDQPFLIFAVFSNEIELLYETAKKDYAVATLYGDTDKGDRLSVVDDFKRGHTQGLIMHPMVGGYGLNLQRAGIEYWYSRDYRTEARLQAEDRIHRYGITNAPIYKDLVYNVLYEKAVLASIKEGKDINSLFMSSDINSLFKITKE